MSLQQDEARSARARMEESRNGADAPDGPRRPARYKLYDRIRDHVSLRTVDTVIVLTAAALIIALIVGVVTAHPQR